MCGRFSLALPAKTIAEFFAALKLEDFEPRYNIAPTQGVLAIRVEPKEAGRIGHLMHWGLIPHWARDAKIGQRMTNARSETLAEKPSFRAAFKYRRCLIPTDGFYEWKREGGRKQPYCIKMADDQPFAFAGLWEHWSGADGSEVVSCTIVTTDANELMEPIHHRMPVILNPGEYDAWLDPDQKDVTRVQPLLKPYASKAMRAYPVSTYVNWSRNEGTRCVAPLEEPPPDPAPSQGELF